MEFDYWINKDEESSLNIFTRTPLQAKKYPREYFIINNPSNGKLLSMISWISPNVVGLGYDVKMHLSTDAKVGLFW